MTHSSLTLVINLSLRSIRTIIFNDSGEKIYEDWLPVRTYINGSSVEQDPNEWWELLIQLLNKVFVDPAFNKYIHYLTVTSSALSLVMVGSAGQVLDKAMMASDKRAVEESKELEEKFKDYFIENTAFKADPSFLMPKILWIKRNKKHIFQKVKYFMSSNDFLIYKLTGKVITDQLIAQKFYFDFQKDTYPSSLLKHIGISKKDLPSVQNPGTIAGNIADDVKKLFNIKHNILTIISTYDAICALLGSSTYKEGELNNVCGTCSSYRFFSKEAVSLIKKNLILQQLPSEKVTIVGASNDLEGGVLEWAKECFYGDSYLKDDNFLYGLMQKEAEESGLGAGGIIFIPYLLGERMPFQDRTVRGLFFGIERFHSRRDIIRSVFEGISFQAKIMLEAFEQNGFNIASVNMSGGLAKLSLAAQTRADVLGIPVHVLSEVETTALGAFLFTQKARKKIAFIEEGKKFIKIKKTFIPNMHNHNCYASLFLLYRKMYNSNKELFEQRRQTLDRILHYRKKVLENL